MEARRLVMHGPAFLPADPVPILRPRDPDPDWASTVTEASFDLNGDGTAEIVSARTVMIPDDRDPSDGDQRVLVEIREGDLILFGDLLEGPGGDPVRVGSISTADLTGDGIPTCWSASSLEAGAASPSTARPLSGAPNPPPASSRGSPPRRFIPTVTGFSI